MEEAIKEQTRYDNQKQRCSRACLWTADEYRHKATSWIRSEYTKMTTDGIRTQAATNNECTRLRSHGSPYWVEKPFANQPLKSSVRSGKFTYLSECAQAPNCVIFVDICLHYRLWFCKASRVFEAMLPHANLQALADVHPASEPCKGDEGLHTNHESQQAVRFNSCQVKQNWSAC